MRPLKVVLVSAVAALAIGSLAACGSSDDGGHGSMSGMMGDDSSSSGTKTGFNDADVAFAQDMVPHHQQALEMVTLAEGRTLSPEAQTIVDGIKAAQAPEIATMTGWLKDWGKTVPDSSSTGHDMGEMGDDEMSHMDDDGMGGGSMPGMMSSEQMMQLGNASDAGFEKMWLRMMVTHHEGAVQMAQAEAKDGEYADAVKLAQAIISGQTAEISKMNKLLNR